MSSRTVFLHVGIAKTGTTYLQRTLFANRELLRLHGTLYPGAGPAAHFLGSLDLRGTSFKGHVYGGVHGAWDRLVAAADGFDGSTLISHETLARAKPDQIERAVTGFASADVRVVVTCRDVARQIPASWQETVKNRSETGYGDYLADLFATAPPRSRPRKGFWVAQDIEGVVGRWSAVVGTGNLTVVTVPPGDADRGELWRRFALATALPDIAYAPIADEANSSLGVAEAELLRRLNPLFAGTLDWPSYEARVKRRFAESVLAPLDSHGRLALPEAWSAQVSEIADAQIAFLQTSGVRVVGDLGDLEPRRSTGTTHMPDTLDDGDLLATALLALAAMAVGQGEPAPPDPRRGAASMALRRAVRRVLHRPRGGA